MKKLFIGSLGAIAVLGVGFGTLEVARANNPEYQQKKNDKLITEIVKSIEKSDICKAAKEASSQESVNLDSARLAMGCLKLVNSQTEHMVKIQSATSNKERKQYKKAAELAFVNTVRSVSQ